MLPPTILPSSVPPPQPPPPSLPSTSPFHPKQTLQPTLVQSYSPRVTARVEAAPNPNPIRVSPKKELCAGKSPKASSALQEKLRHHHGLHHTCFLGQVHGHHHSNVSIVQDSDRCFGAAVGYLTVLSGASTVAIDNKIEQAMDLVKSHLMYAVREEVEVLKEQIKELLEKNSQLEYENSILKAAATPDTITELQQRTQQQQKQQQTQPPPSSSS